MDPLNPPDAQQVVIEYARLLERDLAEQRHPGRVESLPYAKPVLKSAIQTSVRSLAASGQLTDEMRAYLETAYTYLAEYLEGELADLATLFRQAADDLAQQSPSAREKTQTAAWQTLARSGALAGDVARATTMEAEALRLEFRDLLASL